MSRKARSASEAGTEACHHMGPILRRVAEGEAGPLARAAVHVHTLSCGCCRTALREMKGSRTEKG